MRAIAVVLGIALVLIGAIMGFAGSPFWFVLMAIGVVIVVFAATPDDA